MSGFRSEETLVGLIALALLPMIGWRIIAGLRRGRLPLYRTSLARDDDKVKFAALLFFHLLSLVLMAVIAADLLFNLQLRNP